MYACEVHALRGTHQDCVFCTATLYPASSITTPLDENQPDSRARCAWRILSAGRRRCPCNTLLLVGTDPPQCCRKAAWYPPCARVPCVEIRHTLRRSADWYFLNQMAAVQPRSDCSRERQCRGACRGFKHGAVRWNTWNGMSEWWSLSYTWIPHSHC